MSEPLPADQIATPRCDEMAADGWSGDAVCVPYDFAQSLEREAVLAVAKIAELERRQAQLDGALNMSNIANSIHIATIRELRSLLNDALAEVQDKHDLRKPNEPRDYREQSAETILRAWLHQYGSTDGLSISTRAWLSGKRPQFETEGAPIYTEDLPPLDVHLAQVDRVTEELRAAGADDLGPVLCGFCEKECDDDANVIRTCCKQGADFDRKSLNTGENR